MRKTQKQEIFEIIGSLNEAHGEIREALQKGGTSQAGVMLGECQEFAVSLGESIEFLEGEGHITVKKIESYCECLYQLYMQLTETEQGGLSGGKAYKTLRRQLIEIENSVKNDIDVIKEIVFLPYKASMWDSMESVWMAARDDADCDAYVVPIPYYEKNADQSLGKMHYEGDMYPDYVPVTDWRSYKIEERRPDIIYIQYPYDDWNYVTGVPEQYYVKELKKYTDMLIYLPYFVGINDHVKEELCVVPGVRDADRVIVESEKVKEIYIKSIRAFEEKNKCRGSYGDLEKKILPLGSPKIDRMKRVMESGETQMPEEWKDKVYRADGTRKKIVLYNTTVDALVNHDKTYMDKLKSVLALFRQEEDFVLLWRPHPLLGMTLKSMRPDLYFKYREILKGYLEEGWGIYDESADLDRAIILSDAYYGDWSSVVELYKVTGKPILIQNCDVGVGYAAD